MMQINQSRGMNASSKVVHSEENLKQNRLKLKQDQQRHNLQLEIQKQKIYDLLTQSQPEF